MNPQWKEIKTVAGTFKILRMRTPMGWLIRSEEGTAVLHLKDETGEWSEASALHFDVIPHSGRNSFLKRARVPGGWLLIRSHEANKMSYEGDYVRLKSSTFTFVDDPNEQWIL